jgi:hypothetical protein
MIEGAPFEDPTRWVISARDGEQELRRLVNGPIRIERQDVSAGGPERWDTVVRFSVAYQVPETTAQVLVKVTPPDPRVRPLERRVQLSTRRSARNEH